MNILPPQGNAFSITNPLTLPSVASTFGTHFSHSGVGGYIELPNINYLYDIPISDQQELNTDGISSGRRKLGMLTYDLSGNKFYQLIPKNIVRTNYQLDLDGNVIGSDLVDNGTRITSEDWSTASTAQKLLWLNPTATVFDGEVNFFNVFGSLNPSDAWLEVSMPSVENSITGNGSIKNIISVTQAQYDDISPKDPNTLYIIT